MTRHGSKHQQNQAIDQPNAGSIEVGPLGEPTSPTDPSTTGSQGTFAPRLRQSAAPFCPYHPTVRCVSRGSTPFFTRYYCTVPGCGYVEKRPRPQANPPADQEDFSAR